MSRLRIGYAVAVLAVVAASLYLVVFVTEGTRLRIWPWLWIALTSGIGIVHRLRASRSPDRGFSLQVWLLCLAFTLFFSTILLPRKPEWIQDAVASAMVVPFLALIWIRRGKSA